MGCDFYIHRKLVFRTACGIEIEKKLERESIYCNDYLYNQRVKCDSDGEPDSDEEYSFFIDYAEQYYDYADEKYFYQDYEWNNDEFNDYINSSDSDSSDLEEFEIEDLLIFSNNFNNEYDYNFFKKIFLKDLIKKYKKYIWYSRDNESYYEYQLNNLNKDNSSLLSYLPKDIINLLIDKCNENNGYFIIKDIISMNSIEVR